MAKRQSGSPTGKVVWPGFSYGPKARHVVKVGRNEPCPCGSERKYKDCHVSEGSAYLEKLAQEQEERRWREAHGIPEKLPWYKRLFARGKSPDETDSRPPPDPAAR